MKRKFTKLMAALALLVFIAPSMVAWGQTYEEVLTLDCASASENGTQQLYGVNSTTVMNASGVTTFLRVAAGEDENIVDPVQTSVSGSVYWAKGQGGTGIPDYVLKLGKASGPGGISFTLINDYDQINKVSITGYGWKTSTAVSVNDSEAQSPSAAATEVTFDFVLSSATRTINIQVTSSAFCVTEIVLYKDASAPSLEDNDLVLTGAPITLSFDLYNNSEAQTIAYTTSSTGAVTVDENDYVETEIENNTITVTPIAVTNGNKTITVRQAADATYAAGTATFTVNITDSTPFTGGDVTFVAGTDMGSTTTNADGDEMTKRVVTVSGTSAAFATPEYRMYSGSTTTISTSFGTIVQIVFTGVSGATNYYISNLALSNGSSGTFVSDTQVDPQECTWTGNAASVSFTANGQARASQIVVTVAAPVNVATPTFDPEGGVYLASQNVEISCETDDVAIYYTIDGSDPDESSTLYNEAITISTTTTLKAVAIKNGESSYIGEATYTFPAVSTIAAARALNNNEYALVQGVVTFIDGRNVYVQDATAGICLYLNSETVPSTLALGDMVKAYGKKTAYNGLVELGSIDGGNSNEFVIVSHDNDLPLAVKTIEEILDGANGDLQSTRVKIEGAVIGVINTSGDTPLTQGTNTVNLYKVPTLAETIEEGDFVNVIGVIGYYNAAQIRVASAEDVTEVELQSFELEIEAENGTVAVYIGEEQQTGTEGSYMIPQGSVVTLTPTPANGYRFVGWQVEADEGTVTITNNQFTMPACYVYILAQFEVIPTVLYTYSCNGVEGETLQAILDETITLNEGQDLNNNFTFAGWTTNPNDVSNLCSSTYTLTQEVTTFYAVYAHTTGSASGAKDGGSYVKVTNNADFEEGEYLIVYEGYDNELNLVPYIFNGLSGTDKYALGSFSNGEIVEVPEEAAVVTIAEYNEGYSIKISTDATNNAGKYIGGTSGSNTMNFNATTVYENSISFDAYGNADIECNTSHLRWNSATTNGNLFRYYKSTSYSNMDPIQLYKYTAGSTPTPQPVTFYYTRVFLENPAGDVAITGPSIIPSGSTLNMGENTLTNTLGAAKLVIEDGAQYIGNSVEATMQKNITACVYSDQNNAGYNLIASPIYDELTAANVNGLLTTDYDLYKFDNTAELEWLNYKANTFTIDPEVGYLYASGSNTVIEFAGELNVTPSSGVYEVTVAHEGFNLIGNPLAYNVTAVNDDLNLVDFQVLNSNGSTFEASSDAIAPCNAILVQTANDNEKVYFVDPSFLVDDKAVNINLVENDQKIDNVRVRFGQGRGMNKFYLNNNNSRVYFQQGNEEMAIVRSAAEAEMPVSFKASENGTYTLAIETENVEMNYLHLIDNMTGMDVDLLQTPSYTFEAKTNDYASRFRLVFKASSTSSEADETFAYYNGSSWTVSNLGEATLQVVDVTGRTVSSETINGNATISLNQTPGVYMLRLVNGNSVKVQKVVVR